MKTYDIFHQKTKSQNKLINERNFTYRLIIEEINKLVISPCEVLDIGCGAGTLDLYLANKGNKVYGIDISRQAIDSCIRSSKKLGLNNLTTFQVMNFPRMIPSKKFDLIIITEVIEHIRNERLAFDEIYKLLKKDGKVLLSTPSNKAPMFRWGFATEFDKRVGHVRRYSISDLQDKFEQSGFTVVRIKKIEGLLRNFLFINPFAGKFVRFIKYFISDIFTILDNVSLRVFGESNLIVIAKKR